MSVTYTEAREACDARFGHPTDVYVASACARAWWAGLWDGVSDDEDGVLLAETHTGAIELHAMRGPATEARWTLTGDDATPLPDAIDAAVRWMAEHNDPTKGP